MECKSNMECKSKGTVHVKTVRRNDPDRTVIFVPDSDHSAKNGNNVYAVFFNEIQNNRHVDRGRIFHLDANEKGVLVTAGDLFKDNLPAASLLWSAAATKIKVEIVISIAEDATIGDKPELIDIVPAT